MKVELTISKIPIERVLRRHGFLINEVNIETCRSEIEIMLAEEYETDKNDELEIMLEQSIEEHGLDEFLKETKITKLQRKITELHEEVLELRDNPQCDMGILERIDKEVEAIQQVLSECMLNK